MEDLYPGKHYKVSVVVNLCNSLRYSPETWADNNISGLSFECSVSFPLDPKSTANGPHYCGHEARLSSQVKSEKRDKTAVLWESKFIYLICHRANLD